MNAVIIAGKKIESHILQVFAEASSIKIIGIAIDTSNREGIELAEAFDMPVISNHRRLLNRPGIDLIIDLSEAEDISADINALKPPFAEIIDRSSALMACRLLRAESKKTQTVINELTETHWSLYEIGISLTSAKSLSEISKTIIEQATKLTNTPAGSLAVYDEKNNTMHLATSIGFKHGMVTQKSWKKNPGGLTSHILNQKGPVIITDIDDYPEFSNPILIGEGIKSIIACPLFLEEKVVGIVYVDDFKTREFNSREISVLSLLAKYAAIAIEKAKVLEETRILAVTDDLTELYNYRYLAEQLTTEVQRAKRYREQLSFIILDIDFFKQYNDTNGHVKGNEILKQLAHILRSESRVTDVIARYGGEEFTIICPKTDKSNAYALAERLRQKIASHSFPHAHTQPSGRITISAGIASYPDDSLDPAELINKADSALYLAKNKGRNHVYACKDSKIKCFKPSCRTS